MYQKGKLTHFSFCGYNFVLLLPLKASWRETFISFGLSCHASTVLGGLNTKKWLLSIKIIGNTGREPFEWSIAPQGTR